MRQSQGTAPSKGQNYGHPNQPLHPSSSPALAGWHSRVSASGGPEPVLLESSGSGPEGRGQTDTVTRRASLAQLRCPAQPGRGVSPSSA